VKAGNTVNSVKTVNPRGLVLDILLEIEKGEQYSNILVRSVLEKYDYLDSRDKAFIKCLAEGTVERQIELDYILNQFSAKVPVRKMKPLIRCLLRMSAYQILFMDQTADFAVCDEAVRLAGKRGFGNLKGFVNGVLRNLVRQKNNLIYPDREKDLLSYLSVRYSMPKWILSMWLDTYDEATVEKMAAALLQIHPVTIRVRDKDFDPQREFGNRAGKHPYLPYAWKVSGTENLKNNKAFLDGAFTVQDVSSMLAVEAAGLAGNERVLDVCAAPGGKSMFMAQLLAGGSVEARDVSEAKAELIRENQRRLRIKNLTVRVWDACEEEAASVEAYDVVLADVPCSGLGVMGKKRDIKYRAGSESLAGVERLQRRILDVVWRYVKPGGVLVYSTCTINRRENEEMVRYLTSNYPFRCENLDPYLPEALRGGETREGMLQLLPGIHDCDGFFIARLRRI